MLADSEMRLNHVTKLMFPVGASHSPLIDDTRLAQNLRVAPVLPRVNVKLRKHFSVALESFHAKGM